MSGAILCLQVKGLRCEYDILKPSSRAASRISTCLGITARRAYGTEERVRRPRRVRGPTERSKTKIVDDDEKRIPIIWQRARSPVPIRFYKNRPEDDVEPESWSSTNTVNHDRPRWEKPLKTQDSYTRVLQEPSNWFLTNTVNHESPRMEQPLKSQDGDRKVLQEPRNWSRSNVPVDDDLDDDNDDQNLDDDLPMDPEISNMEALESTGNKKLDKRLARLRDPLKLADYILKLLRNNEHDMAEKIVFAASKYMPITVAFNHLINWQSHHGKINGAIRTYNAVGVFF